MPRRVAQDRRRRTALPQHGQSLRPAREQAIFATAIVASCQAYIRSVRKATEDCSPAWPKKRPVNCVFVDAGLGCLSLFPPPTASAGTMNLADTRFPLWRIGNQNPTFSVFCPF